MITALLASTVMLLAPSSDLYDEPAAFDVSLPPCTQDLDCFSRDTPLCNLETGLCVECLGPEHCVEGWACDPAGFCRDACEVDADCEGSSGQTLCDPKTGFCVQCIDASDCAPEEYCEPEAGFCRPDLCGEGQTTACSNGMIVECTEDGGPGQVIDICAEGCEVIDGTAECTMTVGSTGGTGGSASGSAGMGSDEAEGGGGGTTMGSTEGATMGSAGGTNAPGGSGGPVTDDEGCACRSGSSGPTWPWWLVLGLARRRRR